MFMTRFVQFTKKPSQTFSPLWYSLQEPHCCWINLLEYGNLSRCVLVLLISPKKKKKKSHLAPIEVTTIFFPVEFIQILRVRVMLPSKIWAIAQLLGSFLQAGQNQEVENLNISHSMFWGTYGVLLSPPFPQEL